ncbi:hypothetical protein HOLleu_13456 [Holothuria leucospilota]|uniref:Uncharacterized protein n=1 Tax=Holothuria leucospilota TaxID=206669 RepID=A0A9Q1CB21_HOLLE|nr:hypothetical protein HOLleu_13456 [Holothuria leucospilota]
MANNQWTLNRQTEKLTQCLTRDAERRLKAAAEKKNDDRLLLQIRGKDLIAIEVCYHKSCYRHYFQAPVTISTDDIDSRGTPHCKEAFNELAREVETNVIMKGEVVKMSKLRERFMDLVAAKGSTLAQFRSEKLKKKLISRFGRKIAFWHPKKRNRCELVYSNYIPKGSLLETSVESSSSQGDTSAESEVDVEDSPPIVNKARELYHAAQLLRQTIQSVSGISWPPTSSKLNEESVGALIPSELHNFLAWVISPTPIDPNIEQNSKVDLPQAVSVRVSAIAQDILFTYHRGRILTPKHVALGVSARHLTKNAQLLSIMNKFGHSVSHTFLQELDTTVAQKVVERDIDLPQNIIPRQYTTAVWDNIDLSEETLSGKGTTHFTNGILVQRHSYEPDVPLIEPEVRTGRRSFQAQPQSRFNYFHGKRLGPGIFPLDTSLLREDKSLGKDCQKMDFMWMLLRMSSSELQEPDYSRVQTIPSWSGFNALQRCVVPPQSSVGYLPCIQSSPTELSTVYSLLMKTMEICTKLEQEEIVVVLDQAIYSKALQIVWKESQRFNKVILRLGAFHTTCVMLGVIGKRFDDAGLRDVLIESGVIAPGSINGVMTGKHYNRATRIFRIVYEALHRLRFLSFAKSLNQEDSDLLKITSQMLSDKAADTPNAAEVLKDNSFNLVHQKYEEFCHVPEGDVSVDILGAKAKGQEAFLTFVKERLLTEQVDFFAPMKMLKTKTFKGAKKVVKVSSNLALQEDRSLFGNILVVNNKLNRQLASSNASTFGEFASRVFDILISVTRTRNCKRIDFVTDRYLPHSIKSAERGKRSSAGDIRVKIISSTQKKTIQWKKFLANATNKTELVEFLVKEWEKAYYTPKLQGVNLFVAHGEMCHRLSSDGNVTIVQEVQDLFTTQEEADTRMFLHASNASKDHDAIIIRSPDTDVAVLGITLNHAIPAKLYLDIGSKNQRRLLNLGEIASSFG